MKKICSIITVVLILSLFTCNCFGAFVYPEYTVENTVNPEITERINIVFDNSGHKDVKKMLIDILKASAIAENSAIWIYPVAGSVEPVQVVPGKDFMNNHFTNYSKSSNEFKAENMMERAMTELLNDSSVQNKRFILYASAETAEINGNYNINTSITNYLIQYPDILFSSIYSFGSIVEKRFATNIPIEIESSAETLDLRKAAEQCANYDYLSDSDLFNLMAVKNGYSSSTVEYNRDQGVLKIPKASADNNIFVSASNTRSAFGDEECHIYLGGCMMGSGAYESYLKKSEVKGVALSYNHTLFETENYAFATYTADGETLNPASDDMYIPVINATDVYVYHRSRKGAGICSADTKYKTEQDKKIVNIYAPDETEEIVVENAGLFSADENESVPKKILRIVLTVIGTIFRIIFIILRLAILAFIILFIFWKKFRSYVQIKILNTKFGPTYEKILIKIKKIISDIAGAGVKLKGNADLKGDYIFISKASADMGLPNNKIALLLHELESRGISCWLSENGIKAGEDYNTILPMAIRNCTLFLLFISPVSVKSSEVVSEIATAKEHKKNIIPVQIEPFDLFKEFTNWSFMLKQYQKIDLFTSKQDDIKALADQIEKMFNENKK